MAATSAAGVAALSVSPALAETASRPARQDVTTLVTAHAWDVVFLEHQREWDQMFMERNPDIQVEIINNTWSEHNQIVPTWAASGELPDVLYVHGSRAFPWSYEGLLTSLESYLETDEEFDVGGIWEEALALYTFNGEVHGIPYDHGPVILAYNKDLFDADGIDYPTEDWTMDDLLEASMALTKGEEQWGFSGYSGLFNFSNEYIPAVVGPWGGQAYNDDETGLLFDSDECLEALQWWYDMIHTHKAAAPASAVQAFDAMGGIHISGVAAMFALASWSTPQMHEFANFEWDVAPWPAGPVGRKTGSFGSGFSITSDSEVPDAGWRYMREYLSAEGMEFMWGASGRGSPAREAAYQSWIDSEPAPDSAEYYLDALTNYAITGHPYKTLVAWEVRDVFVRNGDLLETGDIGVEEAVANIMTEATPLLEEAAERMMGGDS
jgi:multiple sugar transport system substrate-binding protein